MLTHLCIENFAIISDINIDFSSGMNVILGETGAGKSILLDAIYLLNGAKAEFEKIRFNKDKALIEGTFEIKDKNRLKKYASYISNGNSFVLSRTLLKSGKSIQKINGHEVSLKTLKEFTKDEIDIYSQEDRPFFFNENIHTSLIDNFKEKSQDEKDIYEEYKTNYDRLISMQNEVKYALDLLSKKKDEEYFKYQYDELEKLNIKENEMELLEEKLDSLKSLVALQDKIKRFEELYENSKRGMYEAKRIIETINDDNLELDKEKFIDSYYEMESSKENISSYFQNLLEDASDLDYLNERLKILHSLKHKYGDTTEEILAKKEELKYILEDLKDAQVIYENAINKEKNQELLLEQIGEKLLKIRENRGKILTDLIIKELNDLLFKDVEFKIEFIKVPFNEEGNYKARFLIKTNKGMDFLPLKDTASLGESSRLSLALKKVFLDQYKKDVLLFDEIDIGLSGNAALAIGKKIKELSKSIQVLIITHLSQVALFGDHFYLVKKENINEETITTIVKLNQDEVIKEVSKMISGDSFSPDANNLVKSWLKKES